MPYAQCFHLNVDAPNQFLALDASGKSGAHHHHRRYRKARTGKSAAGFFICSNAIRGKVSIVEAVSSHFRNLLTVQKAFDTSGKSPAYCHHRENLKARAGETGRGLFRLHFQSDGGRTSRRLILPTPSPKRRKRAAVRTIVIIISRHARTCRCAAWRSPRPHAAPVAGIRFAPEMIASRRSCRTFHFLEESR